MNSCIKVNLKINNKKKDNFIDQNFMLKQLNPEHENNLEKNEKL